MMNGKINVSVVTEAVTSVHNLLESASTESAFIVQGRLIRFTGFDYFFFIALLVLSTLVGFYYGFVSKHKQNNTSEYLMGGQTMKIVPIATSLVASHVSGQTLLGIPVEVYSNGTQYVIFTVSAVVLGLVLSYIILPLFFNLQMTSSFRYLERRFGRSVRTMATAIYIFKCMCFVPLVVYVPALALSQVTGYKLHVISPLICAVCVLYTTIGGLRAVVWTDFIQFLLIICGLIAVIVLGTVEIGSVSDVFAAAHRGGRLNTFEFDPNPLLRSSFWTVLFGLTTTWVAAMGVGQSNLQRFLAVPNLKAARWSVVIFVVGMIVIKYMTIYIGLCLYAQYEHCDPVAAGVVQKPDQILPYYVMEVGGKIPGLPGLFIAGISAAGLATMSSNMNTLSGVIYDEFIKPHFPKATEAQASGAMKCTVVVFGIIVTALVFVVEKLGPIFQIGMSLSGLASGAYLGIYIVGMTSRTANAKGIMIGSAVSILFVTTIVTGAHLHHVSQAPTLPMQSECLVQPLSNSTTPATHLPSDVDTPEVFWLFRLSFMYYALTGLIVMLIVTHIASRLTGGTSQDVDESLLMPHFQTKEYKERMSKMPAHTEYTEVNQNVVELRDITQQEISQETPNRV